MDNLKLFVSGKFHGFGSIWDDCIRTGDKSKNPFLEIESQQSRLGGDQVSCVFLFCFFDDIEKHRDAIEQFSLVAYGKIFYRVHILLCRLQANTSVTAVPFGVKLSFIRLRSVG